MLLPKGASFEAFIAAMTTITAAMLTAADATLTAATDVIPSPSLKYPPNNINPKAQEKYWKEFVTKYKKTWEKYEGEIDRQWACCVAIWINYCVKRKMQPFDANAAQVTKETKDKLEDRAENARVAQLNAIDSLKTKGVRKGVISKFLKETFSAIEEKKPGEYTITSKRVMVLEKGIDWTSQEFKLFMDKSNFQRKAGRYIRPVKTNTDVIVQLDDETNKPVLIFKNMLTKPYVEMLLGLPSSKDNKAKLLTELTKYWKSMIRDLT